MVAVAIPSFRPATVSECFARTYEAARLNFLDACARQGLTVTSHSHPQRGPADIELAVDVSLVGSSDAEHIIVIISGTHGLEGLAGSGCQVWWLRELGLRALAPNTALLLVHMLNPWGAAWGRRQTEDNVDLNRNFLDFSRPVPENRHYGALQHAFNCHDRQGADYERACAAIADYARTHGDNALAAAIFQGQYTDPQGLGYGGREPTWSNRTFHQILQKYAGVARKVAVIDLHTGLGPYGYGMLINTSQAGSESLLLAQTWYGANLAAVRADPSRVPYDFQGDLCTAVEQALSAATVIPVALEFGTFDIADLLRLQIDACWLQKHGDDGADVARHIRDRLWNFFYPATDDWYQMLCFRTYQVVALAMDGLGSRHE